MAEQKPKADVAKLNFEEAIKELTSIVSEVEQGRIPLQQSLEQYEKGMAEYMWAADNERNPPPPSPPPCTKVIQQAFGCMNGS